MIRSDSSKRLQITTLLVATDAAMPPLHRSIYCSRQVAPMCTPSTAWFLGPTRVCPTGHLDWFIRFFSAHRFIIHTDTGTQTTNATEDTYSSVKRFCCSHVLRCSHVFNVLYFKKKFFIVKYVSTNLTKNCIFMIYASSVVLLQEAQLSPMDRAMRRVN